MSDSDLKRLGPRVTTSPGYPPMELFDDDGTGIVGIDGSLAKAIGKVLDVPVTVNREDFNAQIPGPLTGRYDMITVTHEIGFAREVGDTLVFMDDGMIVERGAPREMIANPQTERTKAFLARVL